MVKIDMKKKGASLIDFLIYLGIAVAVLVLGVLIYFILAGKFEGLLESIKNLLRFGR